MISYWIVSFFRWVHSGQCCKGDAICLCYLWVVVHVILLSLVVQCRWPTFLSSAPLCSSAQSGTSDHTIRLLSNCCHDWDQFRSRKQQEGLWFKHEHCSGGGPDELITAKKRWRNSKCNPKPWKKREKKMHLYFLEFAGFKVSEEGGCYI